MGRNTHGHEYTHTHELNTTIITNVYTMCTYQEVIKFVQLDHAMKSFQYIHIVVQYYYSLLQKN